MSAKQLNSLLEKAAMLKSEIGKVIVGQDRVIEELLTALFSKGHCLIVGVPGLAKTLIVSTIGGVLDLQSKRIQFTPDLMPSDITGTEVLEEDPKTHERRFRFVQGPVFTNMLLADEINRTPPKTQSALLQSMQEYQVSYNGVTYPLPTPFFVLATQNPIEQEGTYPLAEAQLDRFLFQVNIDYPSASEELEIVRRTTGKETEAVKKIMDAEEVLTLQKLMREVPIADHLESAAVEIVRATRPNNPDAPDLVREYVSWGAGPRAAQSLVMASKARAILAGRNAPSREDLEACAYPALRHRLILNFHAHARNITVDQIIGEVLQKPAAAR